MTDRRIEGRPGRAPGPHRGLAIALLCVAEFVNVLGVTIVLVALPSIQRSLGVSAAGLQWVASVYALFFGGFLMASGRAADLYGRRRMFVAGLAVFSAASLACGLATAEPALVLARAGQGLGAAMAVPAALAILTGLFPEGGERDRAVAIWTAVAAGGGAAGFFLGGVMTETLGWRSVFLVNVPIGLVSLALAPRLLEEGRGRRNARQLDLPGATTITSGLVLLIYAFTMAEQAGFRSATMWRALGSAAVLIVAFLVVEHRTRDPLLPPGVLRIPGVAASAMTAFTLTATTSSTAVVATLYLQGVLDYSPVATGLAFVPFSLAVIAGSAAGSRMTTRIGPRRTMVSGLLTVGAGMLAASGISAGGGLAPVVVGLALWGLGLGSASVAATSAGVSAVAPQHRGVASGLLNTAPQVGTALGIAALLALVAARTPIPPGGGPPTPDGLVEGYRAAYIAAAAIAGLGVAAVLCLLRGDRT